MEHGRFSDLEVSDTEYTSDDAWSPLHESPNSCFDDEPLPQPIDLSENNEVFENTHVEETAQINT